MDLNNQGNASGFEEEVKDSPDLNSNNLSPKDKLQFARWILRGIFIIFLVSIGTWLYQQSCGEILLEIFRTGLLPIASFIIGDYFGSRSR